MERHLTGLGSPHNPYARAGDYGTGDGDGGVCDGSGTGDGPKGNGYGGGSSHDPAQLIQNYRSTI